MAAKLLSLTHLPFLYYTLLRFRCNSIPNSPGACCIKIWSHGSFNDQKACHKHIAGSVKIYRKRIFMVGVHQMVQMFASGADVCNPPFSKMAAKKQFFQNNSKTVAPIVYINQNFSVQNKKCDNLVYNTQGPGHVTRSNSKWPPK